MLIERSSRKILAWVLAMIVFSACGAVYAQTRFDSVAKSALPAITSPPAHPFRIGDPSHANVTVSGGKRAKSTRDSEGINIQNRISRPKYIGETEK